MRSTGCRAIVWDWNGTLLDDAGACVDAINVLLRKRRRPTVSEAEYREIFSFPVKNYYLALGFDFDVEDWDALAAEYHDAYAVTSRQAPLREGVVEILETLKQAGVPQWILSASELGILDRMLRERGIRDQFRGIYGLDNLHASSKLALGRTLMAESGLDPSATLFIGDTIHDFEVATELGLPCVLVSGGHQAESRLRTCGCTVISDIRVVLSFVQRRSDP